MELKTIEKALMVFKCFAQGETSLGTIEMASRLNTNKATMSRVLSTLKSHDFLEQEPGTRRYRVGPALVELARAVFQSLGGPVVNIASPLCDALRDDMGERVHLEVLSGSNMYLAYVADTPKPISLKITAGDKVMPHAHAGAKAIVAFSQPKEIETWLEQDLIAYTKNTVTDRDQLRKMYEEIRKTGVAYDFAGYLEEVNAVGVPVFNHENKPVAGLIIVIPTYQMRKKWDKRYIVELKKSANAISERLYSSRHV